MASSNLIVRRGEKILADHHNGLVKLAESLTIQRGDLRGRQGPDGFMARIEVAAATATVSHAFKISLSEGAGTELLVRFADGHVAGIVPQIGESPIDELDSNGERPSLKVVDDAWAKRGRTERALIMFRYELDRDFAVKKVVPVAVPAPPLNGGYEWHKLIAWLVRFEGAVKVSQQCFFSQYFDTSERTDGGRFRAWPRIAG